MGAVNSKVFMSVQQPKQIVKSQDCSMAALECRTPMMKGITMNARALKLFTANLVKQAFSRYWLNYWHTLISKGAGSDLGLLSR